MLDALSGSLLLAVALTALWQGATRLASIFVPHGLERVLATVVTVAAVAVAEALALGRVDLGTDPLALAGVSVALGLLATLALPRPQLGPLTELGQWLRGLQRGGRLLIGAGAGFFVAWCAWVLLAPALDIDSVQYHLPESATWIANGNPGSIERLLPRFPVGNYPVTNEVLLAWVGGISRNIAFMLLWAPFSALLLGLAFVTGARCFGATSGWALLGTAVVIGVPIVGDGATRIGTDLAATTWLAVAAALAFSASERRRSPRLLAFAIVALGLAIGTKTFTAPLGLIALVVAGWRMRERLPRPAPIVAAVAAAVAVGGVWYIRNLLDHGSPLWPFLSLPGSDPLPPGFDGADSRFISQPLATLEGNVGEYLGLLGPAPLLLAAALLLPLLLRSRGALVAAGAVAISLLAWVNAPFTGDTGAIAADLLAISTVRYLMPAIVLAIAILAVLATAGAASGSAAARAAPAARITLSAALGWGLAELALGRDGVPALWALGVGALLGALLAAASAPRMSRVAVRGGLLALGAGVVLALAVYPSRFLELYTVDGEVEDPLTDTRVTFGPLVRWFEREPGFTEGDAPVYFEPTIVGPLVGGQLQHEVTLLEPGLDCDSVRERADGGYIVFRLVAAGFGEPPPPALRCFAGEPERVRIPTEAGGSLVVYGEA